MKRLSLLLSLIVSPSLAQQQPASPEMQAMQARVMQEINGNLQCSAASIALQQEIARLRAENAALKKPADQPKADQ